MSAISTSNRVPAQAVTRGPQHHFFGYYDKHPWDASGRWMLGLGIDFMDRPPTGGDAATIGLIDTLDGCTWTPLTQTRAWNWQQGCMLQWLGKGDTGDIIFNDHLDGRLVSRVFNVHTKQERVINFPVYAVNRSGTNAVSLNFARLHHQRPGYGYAGVPDRWADVPEPTDDGLLSINLQTGEERMILNVADAAAYQRKPDFDGKTHRFNHVQFGADNGRFAFLHRYKVPEEEVGSTRLMTINLDGTELCCLSDHGLISHYDWKGREAILAWAHRRNLGDHYFLFHDRSNRTEIVGKDVFPSDGHCSFSPDGQWVLTDTYPDKTHHRTLMLYHWESGERIDLGRFYSPPMEWQIRCDLHPRWSRDGNKVCIDSIHEGTRQIYVLDVAGIVNNGGVGRTKPRMED